MKKLLWIDPAGGLAGDMLCGALLDAGARLEVAQEAVAALKIPASIDCEQVTRGSFSACFFQVTSQEQDPAHRHLTDIVALIEQSGLQKSTKTKVLQVFQRLAEVEAKAHGIDIEEVHFHEVGAIDSIVDVVVFCALIDSLGIESIVAGKIPVGQGTVQMAHGVVSLPTPALLGLCEGWTLEPSERVGEQSTPTGAALLTTLGQEGSFPGGQPVAQGRGAGSRNPPSHANITRAVVLQQATSTNSHQDIHILECQVDDMLPEWIPSLIETLLNNGALDTTCTPTLMKKGRPGFAIAVYTDADHSERLRQVLFEHSSTLGVREHVEKRWILEREHTSIETPWGPCRIKRGFLSGKEVNRAPEFEDCRKLAERSGIPVKEIYNWVLVHSNNENH